MSQSGWFLAKAALQSARSWNDTVTFQNFNVYWSFFQFSATVIDLEIREGKVEL